MNYINLSLTDAEQLNTIIFNNYVSDGKGGFKFPFEAGTTEYLDVSQSIFAVTDLIIAASSDINLQQSDRDFINSLLANQKSYGDAVTAGWIVVPTVP